MSGAIGDPFSGLPSTDPSQGFGGISPDTWRNLLAFGAATSVAANARNGQGFLTYGNGAAGPLGAGALGAMDQSRSNAQLRSQLGYQQAQTQGLQTENVGRRLANAQSLGMYNLNAPLYGTPQLDMQGNPVAAPAAPQAAPAPSDGVSPYSRAVFNAEGGPRANPMSTAKGYGQFTEGTWNGFAQANPGLFQGMSPDQVSQARFDPATASAATDWLAAQNAPVLAKNGVQPSVSALAMAHYLGPVPAAAVMKADPGASAASVLATALPADKLGQYLNANQELTKLTAGQLQQRYAGVGAGGGGAAPQGGPAPSQGADPISLARSIINGQTSINSLTPEQAGAAAPWVTRFNPQLGQALTGYALAGPTASQKAQNSNIDLRPGGMALVQTPNGRVPIKNPQLETIVNPDGSIGYGHISPPAPGSPPGSVGESTPVVNAAGQPVVKALPPQVTAAREKSAEDFVGKDADSYVGSQMTQAWLEQMDHAADQLNAQGDFYSTGPSVETRLGIMSHVNDMSRSLGIEPPFNQQALSSWEEFKKANITAGFELSSHYEGHARQAAATIMNATAAVPSPTNSPIGAKLVMAGIRESAQANIDAHEYEQQVYNKTGDLTSAPTDFFQANPAQMYARRAISTTTPYDVSDPKQFSRYLPGTYVKLPSGKLTQVPERPGAPPIPEYLKGPQATPTPAPAAP